MANDLRPSFLGKLKSILKIDQPTPEQIIIPVIELEPVSVEPFPVGPQLVSSTQQKTAQQKRDENEIAHLDWIQGRSPKYGNIARLDVQHTDSVDRALTMGLLSDNGFPGAEIIQGSDNRTYIQISGNKIDDLEAMFVKNTDRVEVLRKAYDPQSWEIATGEIGGIENKLGAFNYAELIVLKDIFKYAVMIECDSSRAGYIHLGGEKGNEAQTLNSLMVDVKEALRLETALSVELTPAKVYSIPPKFSSGKM